MGLYKYQARDAQGKVVNGELDAKTQTDVVTRLKTQKLTPLRVAPAGLKKSAFAGASGFFSQKVNSKDLQIFTRQFATLINAGIPVVDALKILSEGLRPGPLKTGSAKVRHLIEQGRRLADGMAQVPMVFDRLYVNMIQAGEEAGILDGILNRLAIYMEKSEKIKSQVKGALVYPTVILVVAFTVIIGILVFIIPKFQDFYSQAGKAPPALTTLVVNLSHSLVDQWYIYVGFAIGIPIFIKQYVQTPVGKASMDRFLISIPVIGEVVQKSAVSKMTRTLSTLLNSGVGLIDAIDIAARTSGNRVIEDALIRCKDSVIAGRPFAAPLAKEKHFPDMVVQMISIGEQSGSMDIMLGKIADFYEDEVEAAVKASTGLIEPALMVFLGVAIAILVLAMYLPIFGMGDVVGQ